MTTLNIMFWLLIVLLAGGAWAIEAGIGAKHRRVLIASTLSTLGSALFIMFWIEDNSKIEYGERPKLVRRGGEGGEGGLQMQDGKKKKKKPQKEEDQQSSGDGEGDDDAPDAEDDGKQVYNKDPFKDCPFCPTMVIVPEGNYMQGSPADEPGRSPDEHEPTTAVIPHPFAIGKLEILREEYAAFVKDTNWESAATCDVGNPKRRGVFNWQTPGFEQDNRHPVVCISWNDASAYVHWLADKSGRSYRLVSEVEWEYAARAGAKTAFWQGDQLLTAQANFGRSRDGTIPGGSTVANKFGLADVSGNVWEMTADCAESKPAANAAGKPTKAEVDNFVCPARVVKGGSWSSPLAQVRLAARATVGESKAFNSVGFRVARDLDQRDDDKLLSSEQKAAMKAAEKAALEQQAKADADAEAAAKAKAEAEIKAEERAAADELIKKAEKEKAEEEKEKAKAAERTKALEAAKAYEAQKKAKSGGTAAAPAATAVK